MIFGFVLFIIEPTKYVTPWPGDVICTGTGAASPDLKAGDVVEIEITGIGTLRNRVVAGEALMSEHRSISARASASPVREAASPTPATPSEVALGAELQEDRVLVLELVSRGRQRG